MLIKNLVSFIIFMLFLVSCCFGLDIYVSPKGNDQWSGRTADVDESGSNGPKRTLAGAQAEWRKAMKPSNGIIPIGGSLGNETKTAEKGILPDQIRVLFDEGTWYMDETLELTELDRIVPLSLEAMPGKKVYLLGSCPLEGLNRLSDEILQGNITYSKESDPFKPGRIFSGTSILTRARQPNVDPTDPIRKGFLYVEDGCQSSGVVTGFVGNIHNPGDMLVYSINPVQDGDYTVWIYYGADNAAYKIDGMDGRMSVQYNDEKPVFVTDMRNTGGWTPSRWGKAAILSIKKGKGTFQWKNNKGGGIDIGGFVLSTDPDWTPTGYMNLDWKINPQIIVIPPESFIHSVGRQLSYSATGSKDSFRFLSGDLKPNWAIPGVELKIFQSGSCRAYQEILEVDSITTENQVNMVRLKGKERTATLARGDRYYLENHPSFLDSPGEWFYDRNTKTVKIIPPTNASNDYRYAVLGTLIRMTAGRKDEKCVPIRIVGLTFGETAFTRDEECTGYSMGLYGVIQINGTDGVTIENCDFFNIGRYAVSINSGNGNTISHCRITRSAQGGVLLHNAANNTVADCMMKYLGSEYKHIGGVVLDEKGCSGNTIIHNFISDSSRYGITLKNTGSENRIEYNDVWNTSLETSDTGAIEVTQQNKTFRSNSIIANNRIVSTGGYSTSGEGGKLPVSMSWGIYLDSFAGGYRVENNYVCDSSFGGFMLQGGGGNTVRNNVFRNGTQHQGFFANFSNNFKDIVFEQNVVSWTNPEAGTFIMGTGITSNIVSYRNNVFGAPNDCKSSIDSQLKNWKKNGIDSGSVVADPMFLHPAQHDGLLMPDSPVLKLGFKQLDLSTVGPR